MNSFNTTLAAYGGGESTTELKCKKCGYKWIPRKRKPKACPRCKARLDVK